MKKYNLVKGHLTEGQKITLIFMGDFGGLSSIQTTYLGCKPAPAYENCDDSRVGVRILHKPRGKRKAGFKTIGPDVPLVVYDSWLDIDVDKIVYEKINGTMCQSRYTMHDNRYFTDLLKSWPDKVIFADVE